MRIHESTFINTAFEIIWELFPLHLENGTAFDTEVEFKSLKYFVNFESCKNKWAYDDIVF